MKAPSRNHIGQELSQLIFMFFLPVAVFRACKHSSYIVFRCIYLSRNLIYGKLHNLIFWWSKHTHTHTHIFQRSIFHYYIRIYTSPQSTFIYTHIKYSGTFQNLQKLFGLSRSPFQKSHMGGVEYYLPMTGYQNHFGASSRHLENNRSSGSSPD